MLPRCSWVCLRTDCVFLRQNRARHLDRGAQCFPGTAGYVWALTVCSSADIAPATFFNPFQSKRAVLGMMTSEVVAYVGALADEHLSGDGPIGAQLVGLAADAGKQIAENRGVARDVVLDFVRTNARPDDTTPYLGRIHEPVVAMIERGQASGEIRSDEDSEFLAEMVVGALNATITHWLSDPDYPIAERLPRAAQFVWEAIRTTDA